MPKKLGLQGEPIQGSDTTAVTLSRMEKTRNGYSGFIPTECLRDLHYEAEGIYHGTAVLTLHIRDGRLVRHVTGRERSHFTGDQDGNCL